jgi:hypothetical protein
MFRHCEGSWLGVLAALLVASNAGATRVARLPAKALFPKTALVFIGTAKPAPEVCKGVDPPCTGIAFTDVEVVAGSFDTTQPLEFALPEGQLPDGHWLRIVGAPVFHPGERYLLFVRAGAWHHTPVTNWYHSVFRELEVGPKGQQSILFVDDDGRAVAGLSEAGFELGPRIAPPAWRQDPGLRDRHGARAGVRSTLPSPLEPAVKAALLSGDPKAVAQLGLPKEKLLPLIARWSREIGLSKDQKIQARASRSGRFSSQRKAAGDQPGMEKAAVELPTPGEEVPSKQGRERDAAVKEEPPKPAANDAGKEIDPSEPHR